VQIRGIYESANPVIISESEYDEYSSFHPDGYHNEAVEVPA